MCNSNCNNQLISLLGLAGGGVITAGGIISIKHGRTWLLVVAMLSQH